MHRTYTEICSNSGTPCIPEDYKHDILVVYQRLLAVVEEESRLRDALEILFARQRYAAQSAIERAQKRAREVGIAQASMYQCLGNSYKVTPESPQRTECTNPSQTGNAKQSTQPNDTSEREGPVDTLTESIEGTEEAEDEGTDEGTRTLESETLSELSSTQSGDNIESTVSSVGTETRLSVDQTLGNSMIATRRLVGEITVKLLQTRQLQRQVELGVKKGKDELERARRDLLEMQEMYNE
ncbi:SubName: Full=Uncharacterized protein {ECO:0000313/EMBL:CCA74663.1} [Serendipita indica DSM 11827]|uniref:Uncharacterized protein n=1 Tax=Serendipita indica (strain DSM 11827) TaxID=1109443 RepID=G4TTM0_SERID|nr:SubName: Full=Uncharacterized protein {ECO:0000313/EMBL:CCA74663.1} [Serendipita indica DSM 11827]CCA74663.1 hypothetical protein PIIN_08614 [Serendipita indica DSM 11827]